MLVKDVKIIIKNTMVMDKDRETNKALPNDKIRTYGDMIVKTKTLNGADTLKDAKYSFVGKLDAPLGETLSADVYFVVGDYPEEIKKIRHTIVAIKK